MTCSIYSPIGRVCLSCVSIFDAMRYLKGLGSSLNVHQVSWDQSMYNADDFLAEICTKQNIAKMMAKHTVTVSFKDRTPMYYTTDDKKDAIRFAAYYSPKKKRTLLNISSVKTETIKV